MPDKISLNYLKLLYYEKYEVVTLCEVGGQPKKKKKRKTQLQGNKTHRTHFSDL